jgi:hypothetical protein
VPARALLAVGVEGVAAVVLSVRNHAEKNEKKKKTSQQRETYLLFHFTSPLLFARHRLRSSHMGRSLWKNSSSPQEPSSRLMISPRSPMPYESGVFC